jgi:hypothetical protein
LGAGEIGYETDTGRFKIGTGSTAWASLAYFNRDPLTTKGDLYTFSTTDERLAVGANGETLVADSSTTTGLRYQANFAAGKNKMINGDFGIWQRGTSASAGGYLADRWNLSFSTAPTTYTQSRQTFTPGTAPVAGYEGRYFWRYAITTVGASADYYIGQLIEDVTTFAGQTMTFSIWLKADSARNVTLSYNQIFGSGGSSPVSASITTFSVTTSWTRFSATVAIPSISGKTIGTSSYLQFYLSGGPASGFSLDCWGVQAEAGAVATAFQTATGTIQGELAACQRYYVRTTPGTAFGYLSNTGSAISTTVSQNAINVATMRIAPTSLDFANIALTADDANVIAITSAAINPNSSANQVIIKFTVASGLTQYRPYWVLANNNVGAFVGLSAEF